MKVTILATLVAVSFLGCDNRPQQVYTQPTQEVVVQQSDPQVQIVPVPGHPLFSDPYYHSYDYYHSPYYHQPVVRQTTVINHTTVVHQAAPAPAVVRPSAPAPQRYIPPPSRPSFSSSSRRK